MPLAPVVATQLTDHATRWWSLTIGGLEVIKQQGASGNGYGVPLESIDVTLQGPGGVSVMQFQLDDPLAVLGRPREGSEVIYQYLPTGIEFRGFIDTVGAAPAFGIGVSWAVTVTGLDAVPDWAKIASLTVAAGTRLDTAIQAAAAAAIGTGPLRAFGGGGFDSLRATPISDFGGVTLNYAVTLANVTLREAIRLLGVACTSSVASVPGVFHAVRCTVDWYWGLRAWNADDYGMTADADLWAVSTSSGTRPANLEHVLDYGSAVRAVIVVGTGVTVTVPDGSGLMGQVAVLTDSTITTAAQALAAGQAYLAERTVQARGSFAVLAVGVVEYKPASWVQVTAAQLGLSLAAFPIGTQRRRYLSNGTMDVEFTYGNRGPSVVAELRRLTRDTLA